MEHEGAETRQQVKVPLKEGHSAQDIVGSVLADRYEVLTMVGQGAMGVLYRGRHKEIGREVAIKVLHEKLTSDGVQLLRFKQEAKVAGSLTHPNVCAVYDFGELADGCPYLVMDYIDGQSLSVHIKNAGYLPVKRALPFIIQICEGLKHAHHKGLVHRDLKPSNVMLSDTEGTETAKLVDFGIAKTTNAEDAQHLTQTGEVFGSPLYMSPEQCQGLPLDARSDIYSLGCTIYETLTGMPPLKGDNAIQTIVKHLNNDPVPMREARPQADIPPQLDEVVGKMMKKNPADRYQSIDEIIVDLKSIADSLSPGGGAPTKHANLWSKVIPVAVALVVGGTIAYLVMHKDVVEKCALPGTGGGDSIVNSVEPEVYYNDPRAQKSPELQMVYVRRAQTQTTADEGMGGKPGAIVVHVTKAHPDTVLFLGSHAAIDWKIEADPGVQIPKIFVVAISESNASGVNAPVFRSFSWTRKGDESTEHHQIEPHEFLLLKGEDVKEAPNFNEWRNALRDETKGLGPGGKGLEVNTFRYADQTGRVTI